MDTARGEMVEKELDAMIERRIREWTSQGYPRHDAEWRIELQDKMAASEQH